MNASFQIVPWYNINEWHEVYNEIFAPTATLLTKQKGLEHLLIWKARCPTLPSAIESTLTLLEVQLQDVNQNKMCSDHLMRLAYSSAIMRFVNHMVDTETAKGLNLFKAAKNVGIPDWIIELRHDTAHSDRLPPIEQLREACLTSFEWLLNNYWDKHKQCIENYTVEPVAINNVHLENKVEALLNFCISLSICYHSGCNIQNMLDIKDASMRESLVNDAKDLLGDSYDLSNLKLVTIHSLYKAMNVKANRILNNELVSQYVNKILLSDESLFLSLELHSLLDSFNRELNKPLRRKYVECFHKLLSFLHTNDLLLDFVKELIKYTHSEENDTKKCRLAAHWVSVILKAWHKNQKFKERLNKTETKNLLIRDNRGLELLYLHWYPNENKKDIFLKLNNSLPKEITKIQVIQPIISTYNSNLTYFIKDLLKLVRPCLPKPVINKICNLAKIVSSPEEFPVKTSRIYTVDDIKPDHDREVSAIVDLDKLEVVKILDNTSVVDETNNEIVDSPKIFGIWKVCSRNLNWALYPIGQIPQSCTIGINGNIPVPLESMEM